MNLELSPTNGLKNPTKENGVLRLYLFLIMRYINMPKYFYISTIVMMILIAGLISIPSSHAQQYLYKKDRTVLQVIIIDSTDAFITYQGMEDTIGIHYIIPHHLVSAIESDLNPRDIDRYCYSNDRSFLVGMSITSLAKSTFHLTLIKAINPRSSLDIGLRYHGISSDDLIDAEGYGIEAGWRWKIRDPYRLSKNNKVKHLLSGLYLKPTIGYSKRKETHHHLSEERDYHLTYGGLQIGYQSILWNQVSIDFFTGAYLYTGENSITPLNGGVSFPSRIELDEGDLSGSRNKAYVIGLRVGFLF